MSTARFLLCTFLILTALSALAFIWRPQSSPDGKLPLVWISDNNPARTEQIAAFNRGHPDLDLVLDYGNASQGNAGIQKIILQCSSGVGPDIFDISTGDQFETYVESGVLWDITEAAGKMGFSAEKDVWPGVRDEVTSAGRQYSYPCNAGSNILIYNKNVFDHFHVPYPQGVMTWEEFVALAKKVNSATAAPDNLRRPIYAVSGLTWASVFSSLRGEYFTEDGALHVENSPELNTAFQMHKDMLFQHRIMPTSVEVKAMSGQGGWGASGNLNQFAAANYAMIVVGQWAVIAFSQAHQLQVQELQARDLQSESIQDPLARPLRLGCVLLPKFADRPPCYRALSRSAGINARSPRRQEALAFLQYLAGPTYSKLINEASDYLPGNPRYAEIGIGKDSEDLAILQMHEATKEALECSYVPRRSPFLLTSDVVRVLTDQINRMESDPSLPVENLLQTAEKQLKTLIRRNLERSPDLKKLYVERFGADALKNLP